VVAEAREWLEGAMGSYAHPRSSGLEGPDINDGSRAHESRVDLAATQTEDDSAAGNASEGQSLALNPKTRNPKPFTLNLKPYTFTPYTLHLMPFTLFPKP